MKRVLTLLLLVMGAISVRAGIISGRVTDDKGNALPFANVYIEGTPKGTVANERGLYRLLLTAGEYDIAFKFIGYQKQVKHITVNAAPMVLDIELRPEDYKLNEVVVKAKNNTVDTIIRKAIAARSKHYEAVKNFHSEVYIKALEKIIKTPKKLLGLNIVFGSGGNDTTDPGIFYLSESVSDFTYRKPNDIHEVMTASKVSGKSHGFSFNRAGDFVEMDFYKNEFYIPQLSTQPFVTPLAFNATVYYNYHLIGSFKEDGKKIYKIQCSPKGPIGPAFDGYIYIVDKTWALHHVDLMLTKKHSIVQWVDTLELKYDYVSINDSVSVPLSQTFDFNFGFLGEKAVGYVIAAYSGYQPNIEIPKGTITNEQMKIEDFSNDHTEAYWELVRPVPLTQDEENDYATKDSVEKKCSSKHYQDSIDRKAAIPSPLAFFVGYTYRNNYYGITTQVFAPALIVGYNTVEGWNLRLQGSITKDLKKHQSVTITPWLRYGFSNKRFNAITKVSYLYNPFLHASADIEGGRYSFQFNNGDPISELVNTFNTLFLDRNYMKRYEDRYVRVNHHIEPINGLTIHAGLSFSFRYRLENTSFQKAIKLPGREYTANDSIRYLSGEMVNVPFYSDTTQHISRLDATVFNISLVYRPGQKYMTRPDGKVTLGSKWPEFTLNYTKGFPLDRIKEHQINYDYIGMIVQQTIDIGIRGQSKYAFGAGWYPNHKAMGFMDYHHFNDNQTYFGQNYFTGYQLLSYYSASTNKGYLEAHYEHHFNGLLLNRITRVSRLKWQLVFGAHFLYTPDYGPYGELDIGIENIFHAFRIDVVNGYGAKEHYDVGIKFGVNFNEF